MRNERGSVSILFALGVAGVGALVVIQMSMSYKSVHSQQSRDKSIQNVDQAMVQLAQFFKRGHDRYQIIQENISSTNPNPTCNAAFVGAPRSPRNSEVALAHRDEGQVNLRTREIAGMNFCLPSNQEYCVKYIRDGESQTACASAEDDSLNWRREPGRVDESTQSSQSRAAGRARGQVHNSIVIPGPDTERGRDLSYACSMTTAERQNLSNPSMEYGCVRIALCPQGRRRCTAGQAVAFQVVRVGPMYSTEPNGATRGQAVAAGREVPRGNESNSESESGQRLGSSLRNAIAQRNTAEAQLGERPIRTQVSPSQTNPGPSRESSRQSERYDPNRESPSQSERTSSGRSSSR